MAKRGKGHTEKTIKTFLDGIDRYLWEFEQPAKETTEVQVVEESVSLGMRTHLDSGGSYSPSPESTEPSPSFDEQLPANGWIPPRIENLGAHTVALAFQSAWTCTKDFMYAGSNEDAWAWNPEAMQAAVFDGATESYAAQRWSRALSRQWTNRSHPSIQAAQLEYSAGLEGSGTSWAQTEASQRGSFSTIVAVRPIQGGLTVSIVGDSALILVEDGGISASYPFTSPEEFSSTPLALSSRPDALNWNVEQLTEATGTITLNEGECDLIILATDAVAAWMLVTDGQVRRQRLKSVLAVQSRREWLDLVSRERAAGAMKPDDSTVLLLKVQVSL